MVEIICVNYNQVQVKKTSRKIPQFCKEYYVTELNCAINFRHNKICTSDLKVLVALVTKRY